MVRRCEQIVRLQRVVASDCRIFRDALGKARARPGEGTIAAVREAAAGLRTRIALVEKAGSDLDGGLARIEGPLRTARDILNSVKAPSVQAKAQQIAYRLGRMLVAVTDARRELRRHQSRTRGVTDALAKIAAGK